MIKFDNFQINADSEMVFWGKNTAVVPILSNLAVTYNSSKKFVICTKVTVAELDFGGRDKMHAPLQVRLPDIPLYYVLCKQNQRKDSRAQEFYIHIVFEKGA